MVSPYLLLYKYILECENNESSARQKEASSGTKVPAPEEPRWDTTPDRDSFGAKLLPPSSKSSLSLVCVLHSSIHQYSILFHCVVV